MSLNGFAFVIFGLAVASIFAAAASSDQVRSDPRPVIVFRAVAVTRPQRSEPMPEIVALWLALIQPPVIQPPAFKPSDLTMQFEAAERERSNRRKQIALTEGAANANASH